MIESIAGFLQWFLRNCSEYFLVNGPFFKYISNIFWQLPVCSPLKTVNIWLIKLMKKICHKQLSKIVSWEISVSVSHKTNVCNVNEWGFQFFHSLLIGKSCCIVFQNMLVTGARRSIYSENSPKICIWKFLLIKLQTFVHSHQLYFKFSLFWLFSSLKLISLPNWNVLKRQWSDDALTYSLSLMKDSE